jgi:hypothetical protein
MNHTFPLEKKEKIVSCDRRRCVNFEGPLVDAGVRPPPVLHWKSAVLSHTAFAPGRYLTPWIPPFPIVYCVSEQTQADGIAYLVSPYFFQTLPSCGAPPRGRCQSPMEPVYVHTFWFAVPAFDLMVLWLRGSGCFVC